MEKKSRKVKHHHIHEHDDGDLLDEETMYVIVTYQKQFKRLYLLKMSFLKGTLFNFGTTCKL